MEWVKLHPRYWQNMSLVAAGDAAELLYVRGIAYAVDQRSAGVVPTSALSLLTRRGHRANRKRAQALVREGLWEPHDDGFLIVGWRALMLDQRRTPPAVRAHVFAKSGHACVQCGATDRLTVDHIVPRSKGGTEDLDNLQALCLSCNSRKGARS